MVLAACAPNKKNVEQNSPSSTVTLPSVDHSQGQSQEQPQNEGKIESDQQSVLPTQTSRPTVVGHQDLLDRIRAGFAFPKLNTKEVRKHIKWTSEHPTYLDNLFARGEPFLYFIVEEIERRKLPMELALLPAVESAYDVAAVSRSSAAGLWQFVPATGKGFGLRQDWWYDGRHDPYSSTFAALDYLEQLHKMFDGDWFIALAAYNAGPGTLRREISKAKSKGRKTDYLSLNLRQETRRYVPKLMALKEVLLRPEKYKVSLPHIPSKPFFEVIKLPGQVDLIEFSKQTNIDKSLLKTLNHGFKRWATPPEGPHRLLIPLGDDANRESEILFLARAAAAKSKSLNYRNHTIKTGETLSHISRKYGVSVQAIKTTNRLTNPNIRAGKTLLIPSSSSYGPQTAVRKAQSPTPTSVNSEKIQHKVARGDTLWSISRHYKVDLKNLMSWNNLNSNDVLSLNQLLTVFLN